MLISIPTGNSTIFGVVHFIFVSRRGRVRLPFMRDSVLASNSNSPSLLDARFSFGRRQVPQAPSRTSRAILTCVWTRSSRIPMRPTKQSAARRVRGLQTDFRRVSFRKTPPTGSLPAFPLGAFSFLGLVTPNYRTLNSEFMQDFRLLNAEMAGASCEKRLLFKLLAGGD